MKIEDNVYRTYAVSILREIQSEKALQVIYGVVRFLWNVESIPRRIAKRGEHA